MNNKLKARVKARNKANEYSNKLYPILAAIFASLVGQKILTAPGDLTAKVKKLMPELPNTTGLSVFRDRSSYRYGSWYSLSWTVKVCEMVEGGCTCVYEEVTVYIGKLEGQVLSEIEKPCNGRTDYTVKEVEQWREEYKRAAREADKARCALFPFGEND